jgi:hypothetical protein
LLAAAGGGMITAWSVIALSQQHPIFSPDIREVSNPFAIQPSIEATARDTERLAQPVRARS